VAARPVAELHDLGGGIVGAAVQGRERSAGQERPSSGSEGVRGRLPLAEALRDELGPLVLTSGVQHLEIRGVGSKADAGGAGIQPGGAIRARRPVPAGPVGVLQPDLAGALELRGSRSRVRAWGQVLIARVSTCPS
jgi:hypothetical protein